MTHEGTDPSGEMAGSARVGEAGEPQHAPESGPEAEQAAPTPEQLDEREERVTRPRKPMGPDPTGIPESVPEEL